VARRRGAGRPATLTKTIGVELLPSCKQKKEIIGQMKILAAPPLNGRFPKPATKQRYDG